MIVLGVWFWSIVVIELLLLIWFVEYEWAGFSTISVVVFLLALQYVAKVPVWKWITGNPLLLGKLILLYVVGGVMWSFIKYFFALKKLARTIKGIRSVWPDSKLQADGYTSFEQFIKKTHYTLDEELNPNKYETTKKLIFWGAYWPISMAWTLINDPIKRLLKFLFTELFKGVFIRMRMAIIGNAMK